MPYCNNCGKEINNNIKFCEACGHPISNSPIYTSSKSPASHQTSTYNIPNQGKSYFIGGIISLIISIVGFIIVIYHELTYVGGASLAIMREYGDSKGISQYYFTQNLMSILPWISIILLVISVFLFITGFMKKKNY